MSCCGATSQRHAALVVKENLRNMHHPTTLTFFNLLQVNCLHLLDYLFLFLKLAVRVCINTAQIYNIQRKGLFVAINFIKMLSSFEYVLWKYPPLGGNVVLCVSCPMRGGRLQGTTRTNTFSSVASVLSTNLDNKARCT